ncbi:MAG TPA: dihydrodipicolinate synthase family protein, partial [bacterium]|nr:dihydrodipicolinate synthase family protein [bacterium]
MTRPWVVLPRADRSLVRHTLGEASPYGQPAGPFRNRVAYAAVHVVADPFAEPTSAGDARLDWDATLAYRRYLWSLGLSVADAMDTAQRGMGLGWAACRELIQRTAAEARAVGGGLACGANTDQLPPGPADLAAIERAYDEQCAVIEDAGATVVVMASRHLAARAADPDEYRRVYGHVLSRVSRPVILHWLGEMFDPQLAGYWGVRDLDRATDVVLQIVAAHASKIDGVKISLLDGERELALRERLSRHDVRTYTGDDFNFAELIRGDARGHSHALLGIFDAIAPAASAALQALDRGAVDAYEAILAPTVPLSRHIFGAPTFYYKTGVVFLAYLNGHQSHFRMVGGLESARSVVHLGRVLELADRARLLRDPELAA